MAISFQNRPLNFHKFKNNPKIPNPEKSNKIDHKSFWAFLSSILIYISIFYAFNLSPSTLFCTTKFWFFISNTLIIIIAADYVSFSSSKNHDYYDEYFHKASKISTPLPSFDDKLILAKTSIEEDKPDEKIINVVENPDPGPNPDPEKIPGFGEKKEEIRGGAFLERHDENELIINVVEDPNQGSDPKEKFGKKEEIRGGAFSETNDDNEFSRMSDEELNGRVEEFIQRFNRQIRLQATN